MWIREQDPLKQGLKHDRIRTQNKQGFIREQDPLKQGLKLRDKFGLLDGDRFVSKIH